MSTKKVTLRAFKFCSELTLSESCEPILPLAETCLRNTIAEEREMRLNQEDEARESDLLSGFDIQTDNIFATIMRIAPGADDTHIDDTLMKKPSFSVGEMKRFSTSDRAIYKNHYYICFNDTFLAATLPYPTTISRVETYLNWLLKSHARSLVPVVVPAPDLTLSEVNTINFKPFASPNRSVQIDTPQNAEAARSHKKWLALAEGIIEKLPELLFRDSSDLPNIEWKNVIAAELVLKIKNQSNLENSDFQRVFGSLLKPISDTEQLTFKNTKGEKIRGSEILKIKKVDIETTEKNLLVEPKLHQEMAKFLDELSSLKFE